MDDEMDNPLARGSRQTRR